MIAVLTAGGTVDGAFAREIGTCVKALAPWRGMKLIDPAIQAARASGAHRIVVVGDHEVERYCSERVDQVIPAVEDGRVNVRNALNCALPHEPLLFLTTDMPFVTPDALRRFLQRSGDSEVAMPLANAAAYEACYPDASNHVTTLGRERVANGNAFYFASGSVAQHAMTIAMKLFTARKSLTAMASLLDLPLILRFATRRLTIGHLEAFAEKKFSISARAIRDCSPSLCYDIDSLVDYHYALAYRESQ